MNHGGHDPDPWHDAPPLPTPNDVPPGEPHPLAPGLPTDKPSQKPDGSSTRSTTSYLRAAMAWCLIIGCTLALVGLQHVRMQAMHGEADADPRPSFNAIYLARYAVGTHQLAPGQARPMLEQFDEAVDGSPFGKENQLRSAILAGEIGSPEDLAARLESIAPEQLQPEAAAEPTPTPHRDAALIYRIYHDAYTPPPDERAGLIERHDWLGKLSATHNLPASDPDRQAIRGSGVRLVFAAIGFLVGSISALLIGVGLLITLIILFARRSQQRVCPTGPASHPTAYLETTALFLVLFIGLPYVLGIVQTMTEINMMPVVLILVPLALLWPLVNGVPWSRYKIDMGYQWGKGLFRELGAGLMGYFAGLPIIAVGMVLTMLVTYYTGASADHPLHYELTDGGIFKIMMMIAAAVIWAPLVEESIFRAAFYRHLRQIRGVPGWLIATVINAFVFAAIHPQGFAGIPALMAIAFVLSGIREWRGSVLPSMFAHAFHNATLIIVMGIMLYA